MACEHPYKGYYTGNKTEKGKDELCIICNETDVSLPVDVARKRGFDVDTSNKDFVSQENGLFRLVKWIDIPCGHCLSCRMDSADQWSTRLALESLYWRNSYFITLTYSDAFVSDYCLHKTDFQKFLDRLQHSHPGCRYFLCGEYGGKSLRPHGHLILFTDDDIMLNDQIGPNRWDSKEIQRLWSKFDRKTKKATPIGLVEVSIANPACMGYVAQYCQDKMSKDDPLGRPPKFLLMSRRPAIGFRYLEDHRNDFDSDTNVYGPGGLVKPIPKAFVRKLDDSSLKERIRLSAEKSQFNNQVIFGTTSKEGQGFAQRAQKENILKSHKRSNV